MIAVLIGWTRTAMYPFRLRGGGDEGIILSFPPLSIVPRKGARGGGLVGSG